MMKVTTFFIHIFCCLKIFFVFNLQFDYSFVMFVFISKGLFNINLKFNLFSLH